MSADTSVPHPDVPAAVFATAHEKDAPIAIAVAAPAASPEPARNVQFWLTLAPLLSVLITAVALLINAWLTYSQGRRTEQATESTEWRQALNKLSEGSGSELASMLQMESFFGSKNYGKDARSIAATLASDSPNPYAFDVVVFRMVPGTNQQNQGDLLVVDQALATKALDIYAKFSGRPQNLSMLSEPTFQQLIVSPENILTDPSQGDLLRDVQDLNWKLDSISAAITSAWASHHLQPGPSMLDLNGIIFLNADHRSFDYADIDLSRTAFLGKCQLPAQIRHPGIVACHP